MTRDDLDKLEQEPGIKDLVHTAGSLRNRENEALTPPPFQILSQRLADRERMKKRPFSRLPFSFRSPWWMTAACLAGVLIGWHIPRPGGEMAGLHTLYDTIRTTDTIVKEIEVPATATPGKKYFLTASEHQTPPALSKRKRSPHYPDSIEFVSENKSDSAPYPAELRFIISDIPISLDHIPHEKRGRSVAEEDLPFNLIAH